MESHQGRSAPNRLALYASRRKHHGLSDHDGYQGRRSDEAARYFSKKEREAEEDPDKARVKLERKMRRIAKEMQKHYQAFTIKSQTEPNRILDLSVTPGAFLTFALEQNRDAHALAFNLPCHCAGFDPILEESETLRIQDLDITVLAADMGVKPDEIPKFDPDFDRTRLDACYRSLRPSRYFKSGPGFGFDIAICDGTLETSQYCSWDFFRDGRQQRRRLLAQLVLGLEHLREGGTMIVMMNKLERIQTIRLLMEFQTFSDPKLYQPKLWTNKLSSFYMVAKEVKSTSKWAQRARDAVQEWKREWKVITLGSEEDWDDERNRLARCGDQGIHGVLEEFGPKLVEVGSVIWQKQNDVLTNPPWST